MGMLHRCEVEGCGIWTFGGYRCISHETPADTTPPSTTDPSSLTEAPPPRRGHAQERGRRESLPVQPVTPAASADPASDQLIEA